MPREVLTMGIDASRERADNDAAGRHSGDGFAGRESDTRAEPERAEPLRTAEERMEAQRRAHQAVDRRIAALDEKIAEQAGTNCGRRTMGRAGAFVVSAVAGGAVADLAYHLRELPPEYAGLGAAGLTVAAGAIAVWGERRKAKDDADHRPEG